MDDNSGISFHLILTLVVIGRLLSAVRPSKQGFTSTSAMPPKKLSSLSIASKLRSDTVTLNAASADFGNIVREYPLAVLRPSSVDDIITLVKCVYDNKGASPLANFTIAARGHGHSLRGQAMARDGIIIDMPSLGGRENSHGSGVPAVVSWRQSLGNYVDVGGGMLWIDVLLETLKHGLAPVSWTDYLYLTVGGTLSNAGISGSTFRFGPQISNVYEMDVVTGKNSLFRSFCLFEMIHHIDFNLKKGSPDSVRAAPRWKFQRT